MKRLTINIIQWFSDFKAELKELSSNNKSKNLKTNTRLIQEEKENLKGELEFYIEELQVKNTKQLKNVKGLTVIINILILISATFTILGFNLHKLLFSSDIPTVIVGTALIIGLLLIQYLCFYASSIETVIEKRFNRHTTKLRAIKYILLPISIIGTYNFLIGYINFLDNKVVNSLMVLMICISIDFSIIVFNAIKYDKKHLIFSNRNKQKLEDEDTIIKMILFNLFGEKLLKIKLAYRKNSANYNEKLALEDKKVNTGSTYQNKNVNYNEKLAIEDKIVSTDLTMVNTYDKKEIDILDKDNNDNKIMDKELTTEKLALTKVNTLTIENANITPVNNKVSTELDINKSVLDKVNTEYKKENNTLDKVSTDYKKENNTLDKENIILDEVSKIDFQDKLTLVRYKINEFKDDEVISSSKFKALNLSLNRTEWVKIRNELLKENLVYIVGTKTKKLKKIIPEQILSK